MTAFLDLLASDILKKFNNDFSNLTIIFPNKRAGLFLANYIKSHIDKPIWMPRITTLGGFISDNLKLRQADDITLSIKLYNAFVKSSKSNESYNEFYFWGNMLLSDFDDIDKYMVNAKDLFSNLCSLKEIDNLFNYLTKEQIESIKRFWSSFNSEKYSQEQVKFMGIWDNLYNTYSLFKQDLLQSGLCYEGMGLEMFYKNIDEYKTTDKIIFAGFNALNKCEKSIFSFYKTCGKALFYWDYDLYYTTNTSQEAGMYMRDNLKQFPNELGIENFNNLANKDKNIDFISVASNIGQSKLIPSLLKEFKQPIGKETAIILCDEQNLIPTLRSIPNEVEKINITMGYPASCTSIASLIRFLIDLQNYSKTINNTLYYYNKQVRSILTHKLILNSNKDKIDAFISKMLNNNLFYVDNKELQDINDVVSSIFTPQQNNITTYLKNILNKLLLQQNSNEDKIEKEFIFKIFTDIQNLENCFNKSGIEIDGKLYAHLIMNILDNTSIPFSGEPIEGMQLMGLMESRMLDFENIIILSVNENILPKTSSASSSFIPYNLRFGFGMPTPEHKDALFAYYFYRLLQRSHNVKLLYNSSENVLKSSEMSRFMYQLQYESDFQINYRRLNSNYSVMPNTYPVIKKSDTIENLNNLKKCTLSPSALNTYINCPLQFYFRHIANIQETKEIEEEIDARILGNIFHNTMEAIYKPYVNREIPSDAIKTIYNDRKSIEKIIYEMYEKEIKSPILVKLSDKSQNEIICSVICDFVINTLKYDSSYAPFTIIGLEQKYSITLKLSDNSSITIGGRIDRVDKKDNVIRVIDYKTGQDTTDFSGVKSLFIQNKNRNKAAFQAMIYCLNYAKEENKNIHIVPCIYRITNINNPNFNPVLIDKDLKTDVYDFFNYQDDFIQCLKQLLEQLFDTTTDFSKTQIDDMCKYCTYSAICTG